ncbi:hypothetical protein [Amycolatopsis thermophila]|uniref:Uncharacterized protein n=1 Tax=Amycolatopsis thermophila TaxID=206084 RepID=A0ABU0F2G5_9PSEU|nr:hypothetical protein [Amycolatopsis thermophila]MDQ0381534.1 hypothetical protein [Amycolatopsis thermophila]
MIVSAIVSNVEWLAGSGLPTASVVVDGRCRVAQHIVAAGDVTVTRPRWSTSPDTVLDLNSRNSARAPVSRPLSESITAWITLVRECGGRLPG